jgi:hypothetical protein
MGVLMCGLFKYQHMFLSLLLSLTTHTLFGKANILETFGPVTNITYHLETLQHLSLISEAIIEGGTPRKYGPYQSSRDFISQKFMNYTNNTLVWIRELRWKMNRNQFGNDLGDDYVCAEYIDAHFVLVRDQISSSPFASEAIFEANLPAVILFIKMCRYLSRRVYVVSKRGVLSTRHGLAPLAQP